MLLLAALLWLSCPGSAAAVPPARYSTTLPVTFLPDYLSPLVTVSLNGTPATVLVDTGSANNLLTRAMAAKLGLTPVPVVFGGKPYVLDGRPATKVSVAHFKVGDLDVTDIECILVDDDKLSSTMGHPMDGLLSVHFLQFFALQLDYAARTMSLWTPAG